MPEPVEVALYQFGVRLTQVRILHGDCIEAAPEDSDQPACDWVVFVQHGIAALDRAFDYLTETVNLDATSSAAGKALIRDCAALWEKWSQLPLRRLCECSRESRLHRNIENLIALVQRRLPLLGPAKEKAEKWFALGRQICEGYWEEHLERPEPVGRPHETRKRLPRPQQQQPEWIWIDREKLDCTITETSTTLEQLCPTISREQAASLLPYQSERFETWFRVEAGLAGLIPPLRTAATRNIQSEGNDVESTTSPSRESASAGGDLSSASQDDKQRLRLQVDIENDVAYLDGEPVTFDDAGARCYVVALIAARGDWLGPKALAEKYPNLAGLRPARLKNKVPRPIRNLIETAKVKGSRIQLAVLCVR